MKEHVRKESAKMIDWRCWTEVVVAIFIMSAGVWIGYAGSAAEIAMLTMGCFVIDAIVYAAAMILDQTRYHVYMITSMMVTGGFLAPMWIVGVIAGIMGLF